MKTIPFDTRTRIIKRYDTGKFTRMEIAEQFDVSVDFIKKLLKQRNKLGHVKPLHDRVGRKPKMTRQHIGTLRAALQNTPDLTLAQMRGLLGGMCSVVCVHLALKREKITYKKKRCGRPSKTAKTSAQGARSGRFATSPSTRKDLCLLTNRAPRRT
jgi:transposase